jgi:hypothetical protein
MARKRTTEGDPVQAALDVVADLERRLADEGAARDALVGERETIAFAALSEENRSAATRVDAINTHLAAGQERAATITAALVEARRRVAAARQAAAATEEHRRAQEVLTHANRVVELAGDLDRLGAALVRASSALESEFAAVRKLGCAHLSGQMVKVAAGRALQAALLGTPLELQRMPPAERHTFAELSHRVWAPAMQRWAAERGSGVRASDLPAATTAADEVDPEPVPQARKVVDLGDGDLLILNEEA